MNKILLSFTFLLISGSIFSQEENPVPPNGWTNECNILLLFSHSAINKEWNGGGSSSNAGNLILNYDEHYRMNRFSWNNRILANYGLTKVKDDQFSRKTSDRLEINSIAGLQMVNSN